jgi:calcineurin-like phosphoesterase
VRPNLLGSIVGRCLSELPHAHGLVGADRKDGLTVGGKASVQDGGVVGVIDYVIGYEREKCVSRVESRLRQRKMYASTATTDNSRSMQSK